MSALEEAQALLARLGADRFFGTVSFQLKCGQIVLIRKEQGRTYYGNQR